VILESCHVICYCGSMYNPLLQ